MNEQSTDPMGSLPSRSHMGIAAHAGVSFSPEKLSNTSAQTYTLSLVE